MFAFRWKLRLIYRPNIVFLSVSGESQAASHVSRRLPTTPVHAPSPVGPGMLLGLHLTGLTRLPPHDHNDNFCFLSDY